MVELSNNFCMKDLLPYEIEFDAVPIGGCNEDLIYLTGSILIMFVVK